MRQHICRKIGVGSMGLLCGTILFTVVVLRTKESTRTAGPFAAAPLWARIAERSHSDSVAHPFRVVGDHGVGASPILQERSADILRQEGGDYRFSPARFTARFSPVGVSFTPQATEGDSSASLTLSFREARLGNLILADRRSIAPQVREENRTVVYTRGLIEESYILRDDSLEQVFVLSQLP